MKVSTRLSLAEYSLYSGFVVLTLLQVLSLEMVTGPLFQALRLSRLRMLTWRIIVCGQDMILLLRLFCDIHCVENVKNPVLIPQLNSGNWFVKLLTLLFCFRTLLLWMYDSDHLHVGYLSRSRNMWLIS